MDAHNDFKVSITDIDLVRIDSAEMKYFYRRLGKAAEAFYRDPANMDAFKAWQALRA